VAAPIRGAGGDVVGALTISGPTIRLAPDRLAELGPKLAREARALSARLAEQSGAGRIERGVTQDD
jgi:IclR family acetate operon transcriptional repressor